MSVKYVVSLFAAALIGFTLSPSYSAEIVSCNGFESCPTNDGDAIVALTARVAALEALLADVSRGTDPNTSQDTLTFAGMNVRIVNGTGVTESINGTGNLIIGYNETRDQTSASTPCPSNAETEFFCNRRTGSHNLVIGILNNYSAHGGMVVGGKSETSAPFASVSGGLSNLASGKNSSVSGGFGNKATWDFSSVSGGQFNTASAQSSSVSGGQSNTAYNNVSSVSGGATNTASGSSSSVSGGQGNTASGSGSSISGGVAKTASVNNCTVGDNYTDC